MYFITELNPDDFLHDSEGPAAPPALLAAKRYRVSSRCATKDRDSAGVWIQIASLVDAYMSATKANAVLLVD